MIMVRAVVFDIGGVLEHTRPTGWIEAWGDRLGLEREELVRRLQPIFRAGDVGASTLREIEERVAAQLALDKTQLRELMEDLWHEYLGTLNEELADYFTKLRPRYRTGILSNSFVGAREREREAYGFEEMCDIVIYSHEEGIKKPDPRFYALVCERLGVEPGEVVFVDDVDVCLEGARELGMRAVKFVSTPQAIADIDAHLQGEVTAAEDASAFVFTVNTPPGPITT